MTPTIRKNEVLATLSPGESLRYHIQVIQGAGAAFGWTDDNGTAILPALGSPGASDIQWQLNTSAVGGKVQLAVPQNTAYIRNETSPAIISYSLVLLFPTALKYTFTIDQLDSAGNLKQNLVDIDFAGSATEQAPHVEVVSI